MLKIYNTLTKKIEEFKPINKNEVGLYTCGPTVYHYAHIGNLRTYLFEDILKRVLEYNGYKVNHIMNITDVGHLTDDADDGEDKMEKGSKREGKTAWEIAEFYTEAFQKDLKKINIEVPTTWCKATDNIAEQIDFVQTLIDKDFTYETSDAIYFDTTKLSDYGKLANLQNQKLEAGSRVDIGEKKNSHDFALWKFSKPEEQRQMEWNAFGKKGFPGWHIECSAMSSKYLGHHFDIHCGGIDHIPVHHTNEIAQSEAAFGKKPWVNYWMHGEFIVMKDNEKMSKSSDDFLTIDTLKEKYNIDPLAYRFFLLQTHYRKQLSFSIDAVKAAEAGLKHLKRDIQQLQFSLEKFGEEGNQDATEYKNIFTRYINYDLSTAEALAITWDMLGDSNIYKKDRLNAISKFDEIFGLNLTEKLEITPELKKLLNERQKAREEKNWSESDRLRDEIKALGFTVEDTSDGQKVDKL